MGRARRAHRGDARKRVRQGRAQGDDRAQAPQRLRPQARVRHAAQGPPRGPHQRAARRARRLVAPRRLRAARPPTAGAPGRRRQGQDRRDRAADGRRRLRQHASAARPEFYNAPTQPAPLDMARRGRAPAPRRRPRRRSRPRCRRAGSRMSSRRAPVPSRRAAGARARRRAPASVAPIHARHAAGRATSARPFAVEQHRGRPRPRPRRGGDRLRQRRLRAVRAGARRR